MWARKNPSKIQIQKKKIYSKEKQNPINYISSKNQKKNNLIKEVRLIGYLKVWRKNSKLQSKLIMWERKKI